MKPTIFLLFTILLGFACSQKIDILSLTDEDQIRKVMSSQQDAWNKGDIELFMEGYWKSENLKFTGSSGIKYGWNTTFNNYKKAYSSIEIMGKLHFDIEVLERLSNDSFYMIGRYELVRKKDSPNGYFTLIWRKINGKWKIISDMTCG